MTFALEGAGASNEADHGHTAYGVSLTHTLELAWDEPGLSRAEVLALELLRSLLDEREERHQGSNPGDAPLDDVVIDLRDHAVEEPPAALGMWNYDPPAWLDAERVEPLALPELEAGAEQGQTKAVIDWRGSDDAVRFGRTSVRLPFGAMFEVDYEGLDRLRDQTAS